ncbi:MAG TPA: ribonuclease J, partial [Candidatus Saccharimonadales bacterium]|nr:ribonuclease J [Candidatus Saccharimonadales bacterium]
MKFFNTEGNNSQKLKIITLSGTESVTKNMTLYEYGNDIIIVDCGVGFPDSEMLGVDVVIPDMTYVLENRDRIRGLFITHGHEDHIGAVPYLLKEMDIPVYCNKLVQGFLNVKLNDRAFKGIGDKVKFHLLTPDTEEITVGSFKISAFRVNHSVPSAMGFAIKTPQGTVLHMADYRIDWTPVLDKPIDLAKIAILGQEGVLCLMSDCLGSTTEGYSKSESTLNQTFFDLFEDAKERQILVTTISSNISRM